MGNSSMGTNNEYIRVFVKTAIFYLFKKISTSLHSIMRLVANIFNYAKNHAFPITTSIYHTEKLLFIQFDDFQRIIIYKVKDHPYWV